MTARAWTWTLNNFTQEEINHISSAHTRDPNVRYWCYGEELAPTTGTPHLQGFLWLTNPVRKAKAQRLMGMRCYMTKSDGSAYQNYLYCTKTRPQDLVPNEIFCEGGVRPTSDNPGADKVADQWAAMREHAKAGDLNEIPAEYFIRHYRTFKEIARDHKEKPKPLTDFTLRPWQLDLLEKLQGPVDSRKILWIYDTEGNFGKSWMATFLARNHGALRLTNAKSADIAHTYNEESIVVFDLARNVNLDTANYGPMEDIKNGCIFSPKYESTVKYFDVPHVVVFANGPCPAGKFSADRLDTTWLNYVAPDIRPNAAFVGGFVRPPSPPVSPRVIPPAPSGYDLDEIDWNLDFLNDNDLINFDL